MANSNSFFDRNISLKKKEREKMQSEVTPLGIKNAECSMKPRSALTGTNDPSNSPTPNSGMDYDVGADVDF